MIDNLDLLISHKL